MKPLLTLPELTDLISNQKSGIANATRRLGKYSIVYKELWRIVAKAKSKGKNLDDTDFKQNAFHKLHDIGTAYDEKIIDQLLDNLRDFLEMYYYSCQINTAIGQIKLASTLRKHGYNKPAEKAIEKALELMETEIEVIRHYVKSEVEKDKFKRNKTNNGESLKTSKIERKNDYLIAYFESTLEELNECRIKGVKAEEATIKELKTMLSLVPKKTTPLISIQVQAVIYYSNPNVAAYWHFRNAYFNNVGSLDSYKKDLLTLLINAIATYPNITNEMSRDYLTLYRFGIENRLFIENGKVSASIFDNIVYIAQSRGDSELIQLAIETFEDIIEGGKSNERSLAVAQAYLHYCRHEHDAVSDILTFLDNDNYLPSHLVRRKYILGFKSAFEKSPDKQTALVYLEAKEGSFRSILGKYIAKGEISKAVKRNYLNFFMILYRIADRNNKENTRQNLELALKDCKGAILESTWLSEKIADL